MRKLATAALILTLLAGLFSAETTLAQAGPLTMKNLYLGVWPEYDSEEVLVVYQGAFVNNRNEPFAGDISYNIPAGARINMVCETEKGMLCQPFDVKEAEGGAQVVWKPSRPIQPGEEFPVMFEYYYNSLAGAGAAKSFDFQFVPTFTVDGLTLEVKQPLDSSDFSLNPGAKYSQQDERGFTNHYLSFADLEPGDEVGINVAYNRASNQPSVTDADQNNQPAAAETDSGLSDTVIILLLIFLVTLAAFVLYAFKKQPSKTSRSAASRAGKNKGRAGGRKVPDDDRGQGAAGQESGERKKLRKLLLDGKISEETYRELLEDINN